MLAHGGQKHGILFKVFFRGPRLVRRLGRRWLSRYPEDAEVRPQVFEKMRVRPLTGASCVFLSFQSVPDKFYFLLFGAIHARLSTYITVNTELIVPRAISGYVGVGLGAGFFRSAPVAWLESSRWVRAYGDLVDGVAYHCATWAHPFHDLIDWLRARHIWRQLQQQGEAFSLKINDIELADLIVDSYLRFKPAPKFDVKDPFVRRLVWQAMRDVKQAQSYFGTRRPHWYLTSYTTYLEHGIPVRVALRCGVEVLSFGNLNSFCKRLTQDDYFHTNNFSGYRSEFEAMDRQEEKLASAQQHLENRLSGGIDAATVYMRKSAYGQFQDKLSLDLDGSLVVFLHDFYDSPHVYPNLVFTDFWQWICFTIETLQNAGISFSLKPHPNQIALSDEALEMLRQRYPDLQWLSASASNVQLAQAGISCGVTVYGTVAHELAYLGIPSIAACGSHPHYTFDFCRTPHTRHEYESFLKTYWEQPLSKEEMKRQALAFYYMHNLHGNRDEQDLRQAFVSFWRACNTNGCGEDGVMEAFQTLVDLPAFDRFILNMASSQNDQGNRKISLRKHDVGLLGKTN